jgi:hypothetical protein
MDRTLKYPIGVVNYLVRYAVHPDETNSAAVNWKWEDDFGLSKISKTWEHFKMVAPYLYAFHLPVTSSILCVSFKLSVWDIRLFNRAFVVDLRNSFSLMVGKRTSRRHEMNPSGLSLYRGTIAIS